MSERGEFLCRYAERILGRELTADEAKLVSQETSRRVVSDLCRTFTVKTIPSKKKSSWSKSEDTPIEEDIKVIVDEVESGSSKSVE